ncbi:MAG: CDP-diacylglycerol--serine O-phosphatidyltransferase [Bacteroidia bacterium]|nr:CDP-diacylglycerol--serine O-phosphatidyltransferase [Bacteroidia bacterium]
MKKQIPNIITLMNLFSGCIAIVMAFQGNLAAVFIWVVVAAVFDFFDGLAARALGVSSKIGVELDSLADVVSFGVAPAAAVFVLLQNFMLFPPFLLPLKEFIPYTAFLIPVFSAYRLAKFNIDTRQTTSFLGLPTPANALFWISYVYGVSQIQSEGFLYITLVLIIGLSLLMVSEIPMFSLKIKNLKRKGNEKQFLLIALMIAFVSVWQINGIAGGVLAYIAISVLTGEKKKSNR